MKVISKENNKRTYIVNIALAVLFLSIYIWRDRNVFLVLSLIFIALAFWRKQVLDKILV